MANPWEKYAAPEPTSQTQDAGQPPQTTDSIGTVPQDPAAQRIRGAAEEAFRNAPSRGERPGNMSVVTPETQQDINTAFGWSGRNIINPALTLVGTGIGGLAAAGAAGAATVGELANAAGVPGLGRDINIAAQTVPVAIAGLKATSPGGIPSDPRIAVNSQRYVPPLESAGPRYVAPNALSSDAMRVADARQAVRNALMPTPDEIAPRAPAPSGVQRPGFRPDVDPSKPFAYGAPSTGWPTGTETWAGKQPPPSSPTGIPGPMAPPAGYVPPAAPAAAAAPAVAGIPKTSAEARQAAGQFYKQNAAQGDRAMPAEFTNQTIDDVNAALSKGPMEQAFTTDHPLTSIAKELNGLRDQPTTLEDAQRAYSRLGDAATAEFRKNGNSETYHEMMQIQANMRDRIAPSDLAGDDPWTLGRKAWSQAMKMQDLENMKARADGTQNPTTSFKTQVNNMLNNPSRVRGWTDEEKAAARDAAERGVIGGALHVFGSRAIPVIASAVEMGRHGPTSAALAGAATYGMGSAMRGAENWLQTGRYDKALRLLGQGVPRNQMMPPP